ncbi:hypothetical protein [Streptomyces sp. NPDC002851]
MTDAPDVWELRIGVYATREQLDSLLARAGELLAERVPAWTLDSVGSQEPAEPEGSEGSGDPADDAGAEPFTVAELYEELPEQWRVEHPGRDAAGRDVYEVRAGGLAVSEREAREVLDALLRLLCPDPEHIGPCAVPWSSSGVFKAEGYTEGCTEGYRA